MTLIYVAAAIALLITAAGIASALLAVRRTSRELRALGLDPVSQGRGD